MVRLSRRLIAAAVGVILLVVVIAVASAGSSRQPTSSASGRSASRPAVPRAPVRPVPAPPFHPAPAAVALANRMPLAQQVAQLFMVGVDGDGSDAVASIGIPDVGGVVLDLLQLRQRLAGRRARRRLEHRRSTAPTRSLPLIAATQEGGGETAFPDLPPESEPAIGATGNPAIARAQARARGQEPAYLGVQMTHRPAGGRGHAPGRAHRPAVQHRSSRRRQVRARRPWTATTRPA